MSHLRKGTYLHLTSYFNCLPLHSSLPLDCWLEIVPHVNLQTFMAIRSLSSLFRDLLTQFLAKRYNKYLSHFFDNPSDFRALLDTTNAVIGSQPLLYLLDFKYRRQPQRLCIYADLDSSPRILQFLETAGYEITSHSERQGPLIIHTVYHSLVKDNQTISLRTADCRFLIFPYNHFTRSVDFILARGSDFVVGYPRDFIFSFDRSLGYLGETTEPFRFHNKYNTRYFGDSMSLSISLSPSLPNTATPRYKEIAPVWHEHYQGWPMRGFGLDNTLTPFSIQSHREQQRIFRTTSIPL